MRAALSLLVLLCAPAGAEPYRSLARELLKNPGRLSGRAAVVPFAYADGRESPGGAAVAERLETELVARGGLTLVERARLGKVLEELKLQSTGIVPAESALKAGRLAGAELLVTGTLVDAGDALVEVNARIVKVETGEVLRAATEKVRRSWTESVPGPAPAVPAASEPAGVKAVISVPAASGGLRRLGGRDVALRYTDAGRRPSVRASDYTEAGSPVWTEVPILYHPRENRYDDFSRDFSLAGARYRLWTDLHSNLHLARRSWLGAPSAEAQAVYPMQEVFDSWIADIEKRSQVLFEGAEGRVIAYYEPMERSGLRVSLFKVRKSSGTESLDYEPLDVEVLAGRGSKPSVSRLLEGEGRYFRFRYLASPREVTAEEVR